MTRELLRAYSSGSLPPQLLVEVGLEHLCGLCEHCRHEVEAWRSEQADPLIAMAEQAAGDARQKKRAESEARKLLTLSREQRIPAIRRSIVRFRGPLLAEVLLERSREAVHESPVEGLHLAELARAVLHYSPNSPRSLGLAALATAYKANACRARGELREAAEQFRNIRYLVQQQGVADPSILAQIDDLEGSLAKDRRLFPLAEQLFRRAAMLYRFAGSQADVWRVVISLADVYYYQGSLDRAIETVGRVLALMPLRRVLTGAASPGGQEGKSSGARLVLCGVHNLALYLVEAGQYAEAAAVVADHQGLYDQFPETGLRLLWLRARIAAGTGRRGEAEEALIAARGGFIARGVGFDAALVSLDLAVLYAGQGRTAPLRRLAEEIVPILEAQDLHREAVAALVLFQDTARQEALSSSFLRDLRRYLRQARADPHLRFRG
ncbi:MAG: hypothetical protein M3O15_09345 [Acidobacteriota bacterium]|nr:hypothetical protein [Acidobacteriota bacterium]